MGNFTTWTDYTPVLIINIIMFTAWGRRLRDATAVLSPWKIGHSVVNYWKCKPMIPRISDTTIGIDPYKSWISRNPIVDHSKIVGSSFRCDVVNLNSWVLVLAVRFQFSKALLLLLTTADASSLNCYRSWFVYASLEPIRCQSVVNLILRFHIVRVTLFFESSVYFVLKNDVRQGEFFAACKLR